MFLINRTPSPLLNNLTPYELMLHKVPDYSLIRKFCCLCYFSTLQKDRTKFSPRARSCVFLGYPSGYKGYKILNLDTHSISISQNVVFHEHVFPFAPLDSPIFYFFSNHILLLPVPFIFYSYIHPDHITHASDNSVASPCLAISDSPVLPIVPELLHASSSDSSNHASLCLILL